MKLDRNRSLEAVHRFCALPLRREDVDTAAAIIDVAVSNMVNAIRFISVEKGYDPRDFALVTTGGAGPLHSNLIAAELAIPELIIPPSPGLASALGLLVTDIKQEASRTVLTVKDLSWPVIRKIIEELAEEVRALLFRQAVKEEEFRLYPSADMRYGGQSYELNVALEHRRLAEYDMGTLKALFDREHERTYGFSVKEEQTVIVNLKVTGIGEVPKPAAHVLQAGSAEPARSATKERRQVYFKQAGGLAECRIYDRGRLAPNNRLQGPAVVEEVDSTTVILPGYQGQVDRFGNIIITAV